MKICVIPDTQVKPYVPLDHCAALNNLGVLFMKSSNYVGAEDALKKSIDIAKTNFGESSKLYIENQLNR